MLIPKIEKRIEQYLQYLEPRMFRKIVDLEFEMFEADKTYRLPPDDGEWKKIQTPAAWGKEWIYFWFRSKFMAPSGDIPLFIRVTPNQDSLVYIDGKPAGAFNRCHAEIRIESDGKEHTLHIESYSGHYCIGWKPYLGLSASDSANKNYGVYSQSFGGGCLQECIPTIYSLFYDMHILFETAKILDGNSLRKAEILKSLSRAIEGISFNAEGKLLEEQAAAASKIIAPLFELKNGPTVPRIFLIGHAHLDHAFLWPIAETEHKAARTFANMCRFAKEYPEFVFIQSQPCQLEIIKNEYPDIFLSIKEAYKNGNWEPNGGMWVESDCNIPSGESLIRQFLVGKKVNRELLGYEADTLWLPDVFGFNASLPQIMAGCRIKNFATAKMTWNDTTRLPYESFIWRGIDGTGVRAHFMAGYNGRTDPAGLTGTWNRVQHKEVQSACIMPIGEGDGGGGTFRSDLVMARRLNDLEGVPHAEWKSVSAAFNEIFNNDTEFPEWRGELYAEFHRGTYTTQSRTKRNNRLLEFALRNTEFLCSLASLECGEYPHEVLLSCWKTALTNQFHDIIPGSSITRVYAEAEAQSKELLALLSEIGGEAKSQLSSGCNGITVFNDLLWERRGIADLGGDGEPKALLDASGTVYPVQRYLDLDGNKRTVFNPVCPSLGWASYIPATLSESAEQKKPGDNNGDTSCKSLFSWQNNILETPFYTITFNADGRISGLFDKGQNCQLIKKGGVLNAFITAEDTPINFDAWDIEVDWKKHIRQETQLVSLEVSADGPLFFRLRFVYDISAAGNGESTSRLVQDMVFYADNPRIDFETKVDWHEKWRLLKAEFDTAVETDKVRCEIQYGHLWRNTHSNLMHDRARFEICAHKWISLEEEGSGIALLNDCKYGHDVECGRMRLTLLRSPNAPDPEADRGVHYFTYSLLPFAGHFSEAGVIQSAYELNSPMTAFIGSSKPETKISSPEKYSFCTIESKAVIIECVKAPENGAKGELILRLYESLGGKCRAKLHFTGEIKTAFQTDMLEENGVPLPVQDRNIVLEFRPFEIKTLRVGF